MVETRKTPKIREGKKRKNKSVPDNKVANETVVGSVTAEKDQATTRQDPGEGAHCSHEHAQGLREPQNNVMKRATKQKLDRKLQEF